MIDTIDFDDIIEGNANKIISKLRMKKNNENDYIPKIKSHQLLNFKQVKALSFKNYLANDKSYQFKWGDINAFYKDINVDEASFRSLYSNDSTDYFYSRQNKIVPCYLRVDQSRFNKQFITDLFNFLKPPIDSFRSFEHFSEDDLSISEIVMVLENDLIIHYDGDLNIYYNSLKHLEESKTNPFYLLLSFIRDYSKKSDDLNQIHIVYKGDYGFEKKAFDVKRVDIDIDKNYNDGFKEISEFIITSLNDISKTGLYILDGVPGTGKTSFLRYLAGKLKRNIIFISPDMVSYITDPSFIPFLMSNSNSILIIEDAEPALQKRDGTSRTGAISNILNLTDGLLSDCLNISIVATFNTSAKTLDEALLRDGRLIQSYTFDKLKANKASALLKSLGHDVESEEDLTLAEIYFYGSDNNAKSFKQTSFTGFGKKY